MDLMEPETDTNQADAGARRWERHLDALYARRLEGEKETEAVEAAAEHSRQHIAEEAKSLRKALEDFCGRVQAAFQVARPSSIEPGAFEPVILRSANLKPLARGIQSASKDKQGGQI